MGISMRDFENIPHGTVRSMDHCRGQYHPALAPILHQIPVLALIPPPKGLESQSKNHGSTQRLNGSQHHEEFEFHVSDDLAAVDGQ